MNINANINILYSDIYDMNGRGVTIHCENCNPRFDKSHARYRDQACILYAHILG